MISAPRPHVDLPGAFNQELEAAGAWVFAGGRCGPSSATVVRSTEGDVSVTDGTDAESKEHLVGSWIIDVADLDVALDWARRGAAACEQPVEVRPFHAERPISRRSSAVRPGDPVTSRRHRRRVRMPWIRSTRAGKVVASTHS